MQVIIFILLTSIAISTTAIEYNLSRTCIPSRCGNQEIRYPFRLKGDPSRCGNQEIRYPFRLKGDPSDCGIQSYELLCLDNTTFLGAPYDKYLVTNTFYHNYLVNIVDTELATGNYNLPFQALTPTFFPHNFTLANGLIWAAFINCSHKIIIENYFSYYCGPERLCNQTIWGIIPCLSQNNRFIYFSKYTSIEDLPTSCTYMTMVPIKSDVLITGDDIFGILKQGFSVSWAIEKHTRSRIIRRCLGRAVPYTRDYMEGLKKIVHIIYPFHIEYEFVDCIKKTRDFALYRYSIAFVVFLDIISFYLVIITLGRLIIAPLCIHVFLLCELIKMLSPIDYIENFLRNQQRTSLTRYVYTDIVAMTRHFKDRLGQGGFGTVYKGELPGGYLVAVKLLSKSNDNGEDFISEVSTIGMIHHTNVVGLVGFCSEGLHRALVYEYMYNGSLDKYIFSSTQKFTTKKLNEIALGVARGIDYLHRGCDMRILHFDIKPHNILLDSNFNPKVSDFGLAKLYSKDNSLVSTFAARGTIGYMAPELISRSFGLISYKSDVYSFGMLLLEMAGGRRNYDPRAVNSSQAYYPSWIYDRLNQQTKLEVLDHEIEIVDVERKLCKVGLWCIQMLPSLRPTMIRVVEMLEGDVDDVEMPPKPFFFSSSQSTTREQNSYELSFNEISTIYEIE